MSGQTAFRGLASRRCPNAAELCATVLSLPVHPYITEKEQTTVSNAIKKALNG